MKGEGDLPFHARFHFLCGPFVLFLSEQYFGMMFDVSASFPVIRMGESSSLFHAMKSSLGPFSQFDQGLFLPQHNEDFFCEQMDCPPINIVVFSGLDKDRLHISIHMRTNAFGPFRS